MSSSSLRGSRSVRLGARRLARRQLLRLVGRPLAYVLERSARASGRKVGVALVYHRVGEASGSPRLELLPAMSTRLLERHVAYLAAHYRLVTGSDLLPASIARQRGERFPIAMTFDDDVRSHVDIVAPLLSSRGVTATFFLTGASLDGPSPFWWERLQAAFDRGLDVGSLGLQNTTDDATIHEVAAAIERTSPAERSRLDDELRRLVGPVGEAGLRASDVSRLADLGFEIGFHTRDHDRLPDLDDEALVRALDDGRRELEATLGRGLSSIAYPHGRADGRVAVMAHSSGFTTGFTGTEAPVTTTSDPLLLGRVSPSYDSVGELAFDVAWAIVRARSSR